MSTADRFDISGDDGVQPENVPTLPGDHKPMTASGAVILFLGVSVLGLVALHFGAQWIAGWFA